MAVCFSIIGRDNSRLFTFISEREASREYDIQLFVHCSLDIVDDKLPKATELYLGLLNSDNRYKSFGFVTNTGVKFILVVSLSNSTLKDQEIRAIFKRFHVQYCNAISNPFYEFGTPLKYKGLYDCGAEVMRSSPE